MNKYERALLLMAHRDWKHEVEYRQFTDYAWEEAFVALVKRGSLKYSRWHGCPPHETTEYKITERGIAELQTVEVTE